MYVKLASVVKGDPKSHFLIATTPFPGLLYFTHTLSCWVLRHQVPFFESSVRLDLGLKPGPRAIGEHSNHYANVRTKMYFLLKWVNISHLGWWVPKLRNWKKNLLLISSKSSKSQPEKITMAEYFCCGNTKTLFIMLKKLIKISILILGSWGPYKGERLTTNLKSGWS